MRVIIKREPNVLTTFVTMYKTAMALSVLRVNHNSILFQDTPLRYSKKVESYFLNQLCPYTELTAALFGIE